MSVVYSTINDGVTAAGVASVLYAATVFVSALVAILARTATRRRDAHAVLKVLLRRRSDDE